VAWRLRITEHARGALARTKMIFLWSNLIRHWSCCALTRTVITKKGQNKHIVPRWRNGGGDDICILCSYTGPSSFTPSFVERTCWSSLPASYKFFSHNKNGGHCVVTLIANETMSSLLSCLLRR
jgi:hypothetical protein